MTNFKEAWANKRLRCVGCVGVLASASLVAWLIYKNSGPQPVVSVTLEQALLNRVFGGGAWRDLAFEISPREEAEVQKCLQLVGRMRSTIRINGKSLGEDIRDELNAVLGRMPNFFYAEYLLGLWHQKSGAKDTALTHYARAAEHAPVVLIQRYELKDGRPLARCTIESIQIECNRVQKGSLDPSLNLVFCDLVTDAAGCVRLPVYDTVYRISSSSYPNGFAMASANLGWFASRGKVGVLPGITVWK